MSLTGLPVNLLTVANQTWESPIVEGPALMTNPTGGVFLFYSGNYWTTSSYADGVANCDTPTGPCTRTYTTPLLASRDTMVGSGGGSPFEANGSWYFAFHAWEWPKVGYTSDSTTNGQRSLRILPVTFPGGSPKIG